MFSKLVLGNLHIHRYIWRQLTVEKSDDGKGDSRNNILHESRRIWQLKK